MKLKNCLSFIAFVFFSTVFAQTKIKTKKKEILLIGVFHFNNPNRDIAKLEKFDVLSESSQKELEKINMAIKKFAPTKVFTEWEYKEQKDLDSLYNLYLQDKYFSYIEKKYPKNDYYKENEIFQLGFRIAKTNKHKKVYGIDTSMSLPFDSLMVAIDKANQKDLKDSIFKRIKTFEEDGNKDMNTLSLSQILLKRNSPSYRKFDLGSYISLFNPGGKPEDFSGANLVAEWYRRNLIMYSFVQKMSTSSDDKLVVILGSGHITLFKQFAELDENFKVVELKDYLK